MKKTVIITLLAVMALLVIAACGSQSTGGLPATNPVTSEVTTTTETEWTSEPTTEESTERTEAETSAGTSAATTTSTAAPKPAVTAVSASTPTTLRTTTAKATTTKAPMIPPVTAAQATTTTRYVPPATTTAAPQTQPPRTAYTQADYDKIVAEVKAYAESKTKVRFILKPDLRYDSQIVSYHDVINLTQSSGTAFVINELKYNVDQTEWLVSGGSGGVPGDAVYYNVVYFDHQGSQMFVLLYT